MFSCPPPEAKTYSTDPRIEKAHKLADWWNRVVPELASMHEYSGYIPQEDVPLIAHSFRSVGHFMVLGEVHRYSRIHGGCRPRARLPLPQADTEKLLCNGRIPGKQRILKNSACLARIGSPSSKVYPDARFVWPHRDPTKSVGGPPPA